MAQCHPVFYPAWIWSDTVMSPGCPGLLAEERLCLLILGTCLDHGDETCVSGGGMERNPRIWGRTAVKIPGRNL